MKNKEIQKRLMREAETVVPDVRAQVLSRAESERSPRVFAETNDRPAPKRTKRIRPFGAFAAGLAAVAACLAIVLPLTLGGGGKNPQDFTSVYLKINPAVELIIKDGLVTSARPLNGDGVILLEKQKLISMSAETACAVLADAAVKTKFLSAGQEITVCVSGKDEKSLLSKVESKLSSYRVNSGQNAVSTQQKADQYGIGSGKMRLVELLLSKDGSLSEKKLVKLDSDDLMEMLEDYDEDEVDGFRAEFEAQYKIAFRDFAHDLKQTLHSYINDVKELIRLAEQEKTEELIARIDAFNAKFKKLGQKYEIPAPDPDEFEEYAEELEEYIEEAEETLEELADDPEEVYEDLFEDTFEDWLDEFKISMKK